MRIGPGRGLYRLRREWIEEYLKKCEVEPKDKTQKSDPLVPQKSKTKRLVTNSVEMPNVLVEAIKKLKARK